MLPGGLGLRTDYIKTDTVAVLLYALNEKNRLACELSLATGWRIDDVLSLKTEQLQRIQNSKRKRLTVTESKTGKSSTRYIPAELFNNLMAIAGTIYVFEGRDDYRKHRTRQAVYIDLKNAARRFRIRQNLAPHSLRKNYAVYLREQGMTLEQIQAKLNHSDLTTTMIYAFADELDARRNRKKK